MEGTSRPPRTSLYMILPELDGVPVVEAFRIHPARSSGQQGDCLLYLIISFKMYLFVIFSYS